MRRIRSFRMRRTAALAALAAAIGCASERADMPRPQALVARAPAGALETATFALG